MHSGHFFNFLPLKQLVRPLAGESLPRMRFVLPLLVSLALAVIAVGCSRTRYRTAADRDSYRIVQEKSACLSELVPADYSIKPDPRSRFYDATNPDCPQLPVPRPVLNGYTLPFLASEAKQASYTPLATEVLDSPSPVAPTTTPPQELLPEEEDGIPKPVARRDKNVVQASYFQEPNVVVAQDTILGLTEDTRASDNTNNGLVNTVTIPIEAWKVLPSNCIDRMLEFETLREEYMQTFGETDFQTLNDQKRLLGLDNLMELATINSREFQARKEVLFRAALTLTRQRYQFDLNPSPFGNGSPIGKATSYRHLRTDGSAENGLDVPSSVGVEKTLATGGEFLARFANSIVLTFNGPKGFATDIGSELIFDFQQTIFQRDVRFELLTQSERDVVYAVRDYLRFRKQLFRDVSNVYYNLLLSYRGIEINAQDYFTNLRGFIQSQAEYRTAEKIPRIQVDQFEQNVLRTRSNLVNNCFTLEAAVDQLKFRLGLPTEINIFLDLSELESISLKDELSVARQMITRARSELLNARTASTMDATTLANVAEVLADRMSSILRIQRRIARATSSSNPLSQSNPADSGANEALERASNELEQLQQLLQLLGFRMQVDLLRSELDTQLNSKTPAPPLRVLIRAVDFCKSEILVIDLALKSQQAATRPERRKAMVQRRDDAAQKLDSLIAFLKEISSNLNAEAALRASEIFQRIPDRMAESITLVNQLETLAKDATIGILPADGESIESKVQTTVDRTIELSDRLLEKGPDGWVEIEIDPNEALLTGLVQRLDLMNQRGDLADAWRQIKLAGDDLRSIVDLRATQILRTKSGVKEGLDFTFDDSETRLSVALDTPLNRRLQRNNFRVALINYNVGLRNLMAAEDNIKLDVREDLRQLSLDRAQYTIAVASAALAYERVISTKLRLQFAVQNVAARDFLEAQQAYTTSLSAIARQHVNYITDRTELFFDLEAFDVDSNGYWPGVTADFGPGVNTDFQSTNPRPYDQLPPKIHYSKTIRQMEQIPPGAAIIAPAR
jgi:hypothetical protein